MSAPGRLPRWADLGLLPIVSLFAALAVSAAIIAIVGESPWVALRLMAAGAFGSSKKSLVKPHKGAGSPGLSRRSSPICASASATASGLAP